MSKDNFTIALSILIPEGHEDLIINDEYRYVLDKIIRQGKFIYKVCDRRTWASANKIYKAHHSTVKNHFEYLKLKYE